MSARRWPNAREYKEALGNQHLGPAVQTQETKPTKFWPRKLSCGQVVTLWRDGKVSNKA